MTDPLTGKKIVVLGLARQGIAATEWLTTIGAQVVASDIREAHRLEDTIEELRAMGDVEFAVGGHPPKILRGASALVVSGGVPLHIPIVQQAFERGIRVTNDAQLFLERCPCHVIGITGSAGKTTTTTLVGKMCEAAGMLPWVGGNIGNPLITDLPYIRPDDLAVMELSSFQLELMTNNSPHIAAVLNITPNHLDRHGTMDAYIEAKAHILDYQIVGDKAVLNKDDPVSASLAERVQADLLWFSARVPVDVGAWLAGEAVVVRAAFTQPMERVIAVADIPLRGAHNLANVLAACAIAAAAGVPADAMHDAIREFEGVEHRLEVVDRIDGVTYINDSIATAPERVVAAVKAFQEPLILLLGGQDKDLPWEDLARLAVRQSRALITFGECGPMVADKLAEAKSAGGYDIPIEEVATLEAAFQRAAERAQPGDIVLLSPGGTSFDAYHDFAERGEHFRRLVGELAAGG